MGRELRTNADCVVTAAVLTAALRSSTELERAKHA